MEKRTLLIFVGAIALVILAVFLFNYMKLRATLDTNYQCPSGSCYANWGQDDPLKNL